MPYDRGPDQFTWGDLLRAGLFMAGAALITIGGVVVVFAVAAAVTH